jgi:hypothetical protein
MIDDDEILEDSNDEYDYDGFYEDLEDREFEERILMAANCKCGAWAISKSGEIFHVADCVCGAE